VLEHHNDPGVLLRTLFNSLHDDGVLIVTVPNGMGPREAFVTKPIINLQKKNNWLTRLVFKTKRFFGYSGTTVQSDADDLTHIQFFTKRKLKELASQNSFQIEKVASSNFIDDVFPFSLVTKRVRVLQKLDCAVADLLPVQFTGGFLTIWSKKR
jgi:hypothetical protein